MGCFGFEITGTIIEMFWVISFLVGIFFRWKYFDRGIFEVDESLPQNLQKKWNF